MKDIGSYYKFTTVPNQEEYLIPFNINELKDIYIIIGRDKIKLDYALNRNDYFKGPKVCSLPYKYITEITREGFRVYFYYIPDYEYSVLLEKL